ncbi:MAG TPA: glycosyl hydrolase 115 family protein, partial [Acidobacteriota bacterium]|nr:glycosyl hydrolase 115 family protein [Acidobacteriota bacterium]
CTYKEVLDLYRGGLRVPDDVTIVWPDDNFGYVRNFASPEERQRSGGFGVYYHISYLGRPLAYLWLCTTPPALIWSEMTKSYAHGADRVWIVNVGDLKPAEIGTEFFLRLAWDVKQWGPDAQPKFLREFAAREFGPGHADRIAAILDRYYTLNFARKPEHLQWWLPKEPPRPSDWSDVEIALRCEAFGEMLRDLEKIQTVIPSTKRDSLFQLVEYPVRGSALANERYFRGERGELDAARAADAELRELTRRFNEEVAAGKWRGLMRLEPADDDWKSMRIAPWAPLQQPRQVVWPREGQIKMPAPRIDWSGNATPVSGLGRSGEAVALTPTSAAEFGFETGELDQELTFELLPTHPLRGDSLRLAFAIDDGPLQTLALPVRDGGPEWAPGVLNGYRPLTTRIRLSGPGAHQLTIRGVDDGVVLERIVLTPVQP